MALAPRWLGWCSALVFAAACASPPTSTLAVDAADATQTAADLGGAAADVATDNAVPRQDSEPDAGADTAAGDGGAADAPDTALAPTPTTVWVHYPKPITLTLRGNLAPLTWQTDALPKSVTGEMALFELPTSGGPWQVKPQLTGQWSIGPNYVAQPQHVRHLYPYFNPQVAAPRRDDFTMTGPDGQPRKVRVRLPAGYDENTAATYPLLVMLDGQNVFDAATATFGVAWELDDAVDLAMQQAKLTEVVVAAVDHAGPQRIYEYTPWADADGQGGGGPNFFAWANSKLLPALHSKYRLQPGPTAHTIGGSSLGGLMSLFAVGAYPDNWRNAIAMSGSWWWADLKMQSWIQTAPGTAQLPKVWLDAGDTNDGLADTQALQKVLVTKGWTLGQTLGYYEAKGANHSEKFWAARVHLPLQFFFDPGDRVPAF